MAGVVGTCTIASVCLGWKRPTYAAPMAGGGHPGMSRHTATPKRPHRRSLSVGRAPGTPRTLPQRASSPAQPDPARR